MINDMNQFIEEFKQSYIKHFTELIVDNFLIHMRYMNINTCRYDYIVNSTFDEVRLSASENQEMIAASKEILRQRYGIEVIQDNPIRIKQEPPRFTGS